MLRYCRPVNSPAAKAKPDHFDARLESLRGIAALAVAWGHSNYAFLIRDPSASIESTKSVIVDLFSSGAAVVLFFVLSGYVLGLSLQKDGNFLRFAIKRLTRIFPALWLGVTATYILQILLARFFDQGQMTGWFQTVFLKPPSVADYLRCLVLAKKSIDPVTWSLIPEVVCSLLLPALLLLQQRLGPMSRLFLLAAIAIFSHFAHSEAMQFLVAFYVGLSIADVAARLSRLPQAACILLFLAGWLVMTLGVHSFEAYFSSFRECCTIGAAMMVSAIVAAPASFQPLNWAPMRFFGRISYSLYLLHLPSLMLVCAAKQAFFGNVLPNSYETMLLALLSICLAVLLSALSHRFVEVPGIAFGRRLIGYRASRRELARA